MNRSENAKSGHDNQRRLGVIGIIILTIIIAIAMVWVNTYRRSARYDREGEIFLQEGKLLEAVTNFEIAAHAYTPWNPHVTHALEQMWEIGQKLEIEKTNPDYALIAYRSLRSSIYATRSFYTPNEAWISRCDERISVLVNLQNQPTSSSIPVSPATVQK